MGCLWETTPKSKLYGGEGNNKGKNRFFYELQSAFRSVVGGRRTVKRTRVPRPSSNHVVAIKDLLEGPKRPVTCIHMCA